MRVSRTSRILLGTAAAVLALWCAAPWAPAEDSELPILEGASLEWNGRVRVPGWVTYRLSLMTLAEPFEGRVCIQAGGDYCSEIRLARDSKLEVRIPVLVREGAPDPVARLETLRGSPYENSDRPLPAPTPLRDGEVLFVVAAEDPSRWLEASRTLEGAQVLSTPLAGLPATAGEYEAFDILLLTSVIGITSERRAAIWTWMHRGGILLLPGPEAFEQEDRTVNLHWLFPGAELGRDVDVGRVLQRWGAWNYETVFLETVGMDPARSRPSPFGEGRVLFQPVGNGGLVFLTRPMPSLRDEGGSEESMGRFWRLAITDLAGFENGSPPNPRRSGNRLMLVEPRVYGFFESARWPQGLLARAEIFVLGYAAIGALAIFLSFGIYVRKRIHFTISVGVCLAGSLVALLAVAPRRTAVGEILDLVEMGNGQILVSHEKFVHLASFAPSTLDCSIPSRDWRVQPVVLSLDDLDRFQPKWTFGTLDNAKELAIKGIRLPEGGRFLVRFTRPRIDFGRLTARWESPLDVVLKNEVRNPLRHCIFLTEGRVMKLDDFAFGDPPRRVDLGGEWLGIQEFLEALAVQHPEEARILRAFHDEYPLAGRTVFLGVLEHDETQVQSENLRLGGLKNPLVHMTLPDPPE